MKTRQLSVHIIIEGRSGLKNASNISVKLTRPSKISEFCSIVNRQQHEKAIRYALLNGKVIHPLDTRGPVQLILTKKAAYWDNIG